MIETVESHRLSGSQVQEVSVSKDLKVREAQQAVVELLGQLSELMTGIGEEARERYQHALALREFAETMYLAFGDDLSSDIQDIRHDKMTEYGFYLKSGLLGDNRLRQSAEFLAKDNPEATELLQQLEAQPHSFGIREGLDLVNHLLGVDLEPDYFRNAAGRGLSIAFNQMSDIMSERRSAMMAAMQEAREPIRVLQDMVQGQEETLR